MSNKNEPMHYVNGLNKGLTKREYFASQALQGILSKAEGWDYDKIVNMSVMFADMTLERLEKTK